MISRRISNDAYTAYITDGVLTMAATTGGTREETIEFLLACLEELGSVEGQSWAIPTKNAQAALKDAAEAIIARLNALGESAKTMYADRDSQTFRAALWRAKGIVREECGLD